MQRLKKNHFLKSSFNVTSTYLQLDINTNSTSKQRCLNFILQYFNVDSTLLSDVETTLFYHWNAGWGKEGIYLLGKYY